MAVPAAIPVIKADSGARLPVTIVAANGKPVIAVTSGAAVPVVVVASGGVPVVDTTGDLAGV